MSRPHPVVERSVSAIDAAVAEQAMVGQNVVCFAKDWEESPTSNNYVMRLLARQNRVLWINSIATRSPNLRDGRDLRKIARKLISFARGPKQVEPTLWVYTPIVLPFPHSRVATRLNGWILRTSLKLIRRRLGFRGPFQLWVFIPTAARYVRKLGQSLLVYYVTDEYSRFSYVDAASVAADDVALCESADIIFCTAQSLIAPRRQRNPETYLAPHGVSHREFAAALDPDTQIPADLAQLHGPIIGYYGAIQDWLDLELLERLATRHPEWTIALIGPVLTDVSRLRKLSNVAFLGKKPHAELPAYCKGMSVGLIPHRVNELTRNMNPIKLREYLSAGLPVVSTAIPEVEAYQRWCAIAHDHDAFEQAIIAAIRGDSPSARRERSDAMRSETWERRVAEIGKQVMRVRALAGLRGAAGAAKTHGGGEG